MDPLPVELKVPLGISRDLVIAPVDDSSESSPSGEATTVDTLVVDDVKKEKKDGEDGEKVKVELVMFSFSLVSG